MNSYSIALYLHIVGALGIFVALGLEWTCLSQIRSAMTPVQVYGWMGILKNLRKFGFISMLATVLTGLYLTVAYWGGEVWIYVTLGSLVLMIALAQAITAPRMAVLGQALVTEKGPISKNFHSLANNLLLSISLQTRAAIALGIILVKIAKPDLGGSLLTIAVAIVLGVASALPGARREQAGEASAN